MVVAVSAVAGPTVAGAVLAIADWHWLFAMNLPMGAAALIMGALFLPKREMRRDRRFDKKAAVANALTFGLLIYSIEGFAHHESLWLLAILLMLLVVVATWYIRDQLHKENPLLPVDLMKIPIFSLSVVTSVCSFTAQMLALISLPFFFRILLAERNRDGVLITPWPVAILFAAPAAGLSGRAYPRRTFGRNRNVYIGNRPVFIICTFRSAFQYGYNMAHGSMRRWVRFVSDSEQQYNYFFCTPFP